MLMTNCKVMDHCCKIITVSHHLLMYVYLSGAINIIEALKIEGEMVISVSPFCGLCFSVSYLSVPLTSGCLPAIFLQIFVKEKVHESMSSRDFSEFICAVGVDSCLMVEGVCLADVAASIMVCNELMSVISLDGFLPDQFCSQSQGIPMQVQTERK